MENEKFIYGFKTDYGFGLEYAEIKKYLILKETAKTYIVREITGGDPRWCSQHTIKKATMEAYYTRYALTYAEALERLKQTIADSIEVNARKVVYLNSKNEKLAARLKELRTGGGNNDS